LRGRKLFEPSFEGVRKVSLPCPKMDIMKELDLMDASENFGSIKHPNGKNNIKTKSPQTL